MSVTNKDGIADFARLLSGIGFEVVSTGGTRKVIADAGVPVTTLSEVTGFPEMLDGRVKTLHPRIHGGVLARRTDAHLSQLRTHEISPIDVVVVNLYAFEDAAANPDLSFDDVMEQIDIGGPTLLRAAAKNHAAVLAVSDPADYPEVVERLREDRVDAAFRRRLALKVFRHTSHYDRAIAAYFEAELERTNDRPPTLSRSFNEVASLRYGENPHQAATLYRAEGAPFDLGCAQQLHGKALSYNNYLDLDAALGIAADFEGTGAVYIKHNNPCGAALHETPAEALRIARACDPLSAFGSVVALNRLMDRAAAEVLVESFVEAIIAPDFADDALEVLKTKKNLRILRLAADRSWRPAKERLELRQIRGGFLLQTEDGGESFQQEVPKGRVVTTRPPTEDEWKALNFAWTMAKHVKSNAIVFSAADRLVAVGAGQMSRVDSVRICALKRGDALPGTVVASDAFFPFRDGIDELAGSGATAIVQPGGSVRDQEVIDAANEHGLAMVFTGFRHFRH